MPCCALAACIVGQILLVLGMVKRFLFGGAAAPEENPAVEWRLGMAPAAVPAPAGFGLWSRRGLPLLVAVEILLVVAGVWGWREHFGPDADHDHTVHVHASSSSAR
jgi:hypothetical protein